ncbi:MAG: hypothetical protein J6Y17_03035 [Elusimicrobiaceae bacterium]|nr:hypothetical protein [Elusimicrobiaceae bacterium]
MKHILHSKAGVTVLEGVIALGLLALVAAGAFGVLLSASRQDSMPDIREEMSYAVEKANDKLKVYLQATQIGDVGYNYLPNSLKQGLCYADGIIDNNPLAVNDSGHNIGCLLPPICDKNNNSSFFYIVSGNGPSRGNVVSTRQEGTPNTYGTKAYGEGYSMSSVGSGYQITYKIRCNGYEL